MLQQLEQPIHPQQKKKVLEAIHTGGLKVSPAAIAEAANLPILVVAQELNQIATETGAHLEVTAGGSVNYVFPPKFEQAYALRGPKNFFRNCLRVVVNSLVVILRTTILVSTFLLRISFGLMLLASVVALIVIIIVAIIAALTGNNDAGGGGDSGGGNIDLGLTDGLGDAFASQWSLSYWCFDWLWDWIFFPRYMWGYPYGYYRFGFGYQGDPYDPRWDPFGTGTTYSSNSRQSSNESNAIASGDKKTRKPRTKFLDSCFEILFGAEDPNQGLIQRQWNDIVRTIRTHHGVVVAEQLSPYLNGNKENEDWMLPILLRLNGLPDVSESGNIIYMFPAFMNLPSEQHDSNSSGNISSSETATQEKAPSSSDADQLRALYTGHLKRQKVINVNVQKSSEVEPFLQEQPLTLLPEGCECESVYVFVAIAIALSGGCLYYSHNVLFLQHFRLLYYGILGYSSLFFIFPAIRSFMNNHTNQKIEKRNNKRIEASTQMRSPSAEIEKKLEEARLVAISSMNEDNNKIVYTTTEDLLEQATNQSEKLT
jgi:hypothetical protein